MRSFNPHTATAVEFSGAARSVRQRTEVRLPPHRLTQTMGHGIFFVVAFENGNTQRPNLQPGTLGAILYSKKAAVGVTEKEWVLLINAIANGDQIAFHSLFEQLQRIVFTLIVRIVGNREAAEELTVDVFYDVWRKAATYHPEGGPVIGWILNQSRSRAIDRLRFDNRKKRVNPHSDIAAPAGAGDPQHTLQVEEEKRMLQDAFNDLTPDERQAIEMTYFSELTYSEAAVQLNQPLGTVKTRIRSGLSKLRRTLSAPVKGI